MMMKSIFSAPRGAVLFLTLFLTTTVSWAWQACSNNNSGSSDNDTGSGTCPTGDTCCATSTPGVSTCISGKVKELGLSGSCCLDDDDDNDDNNGNNNNGTTASYFATTGCGVGFQCAKDDPASTTSSSSSSSYRYCQRIDDNDDENPPILPRIRLCSLPDKALKELYGFPVAPYVTTNPTHAEQEQEHSLLFAYYSNLGPLLLDDDTTTNTDRSNDKFFTKVKKVIVVIHGSGRNADDYLCCMNAALPPVPGRTHNHDDPTNSTILVISPWFLAPEDLPVNITTTTSSSSSSSSTRTTASEPLVWEEDGPIEHTWRYGADALNSNVSAYAAVDAILDYIITAMNNNDKSHRRFENLRDIIVIGHSAGGQYTQRWALLSNSTVFATTTDTTIKKPSIRVIVANPRAFSYLDNRRYIVDEEEEQDEMAKYPSSGMSFRIPDQHSLNKCPEYDEWEWGLSKTREGHDDFLPTPYKDRAIARAAANNIGTYESGVQVIVERYGLQRKVIYLAGQLDVLPNGSNCQENIQGDYRRQRSFRFFMSLSEIYKHHQKLKHYRLVVHGVHHDHCLMFQSPEGQQAMFGNYLDDDDITTRTTTSKRH